MSRKYFVSKNKRYSSAYVSIDCAAASSCFIIVFIRNTIGIGMYLYRLPHDRIEICPRYPCHVLRIVELERCGRVWTVDIRCEQVQGTGCTQVTNISDKSFGKFQS